MKLSIYIPTLARNELFERALRSIKRSIAFAERTGTALPGEAYEIVIVENVRPVSKARNEGLSRTSGDWLATVDSDDEVTEEWFSEICQAIRHVEQEAMSVDDILFDMTVVRGNREIPHRYARQGLIRATEVAGDVLRNMRLGGHLFRHVMRKSLWDDVRFEDVPVMEDVLALAHALGKARNVLHVAKELYRYIERDGSLCRETSCRVFFEIFRDYARRFGRSAAIGACVAAYGCLYDRDDVNGEARRWIRRHLWQALCDKDVPSKWKMKFFLASCGILVRRPMPK